MKTITKWLILSGNEWKLLIRLKFSDVVVVVVVLVAFVLEIIETSQTAPTNLEIFPKRPKPHKTKPKINSSLELLKQTQIARCDKKQSEKIYTFETKNIRHLNSSAQYQESFNLFWKQIKNTKYLIQTLNLLRCWKPSQHN